MESELDKLRKRAEDAQLGYGSDVNINCHVYAKDVMYLLDYIEKLQKSVESGEKPWKQP